MDLSQSASGRNISHTQMLFLSAPLTQRTNSGLVGLGQGLSSTGTLTEGAELSEARADRVAATQAGEA